MLATGAVPGAAALFDAAADGDVLQVRRLLTELRVPVDTNSQLSMWGGRRAPTALLCAVTRDRADRPLHHTLC